MDNEQDFNDDLMEEEEGYEINPPISLRSYPSDYSQPPALSYSYSGISNSSSNHQIHLQSSRTSEEPTDTVSFFQAGQMYDSILNMVKEVHQSLMLQEDIVLYILYFYKWSKDHLYEEYYDKAHIFQQKNLLLKNYAIQYYSGLCGVCCEQKQLIPNPLCSHKYCRECWNGYIQDQLKDGAIFFGCMDGCSQCPVLPNSFIIPYFPKKVEKYRKMTCINYSKFNRNISYCPGGGKLCDYFCQMRQGMHINTVQCLCGNFFCFRCQKQPHFPSACMDVGKWEQVLNNEEGNMNWISQNTVKCPSCSALVNKYIGCSYVKCLCGTEFCYNCCQKWDQIHKMNKGECLKMKRKSSLKERTSQTLFLELQQKIMAITRTMNRHMQIVAGTLGLIKQQWILTKFNGIRKQVAEAWYALKWGLIAQFLYKKEGVDQFIEEQFVGSITNLMDTVERAYNHGRSISLKQLVQISDEIFANRQILKKNQNIWLDAWRNC